jgi:hypothetical protein
MFEIRREHGPIVGVFCDLGFLASSNTASGLITYVEWRIRHPGSGLFFASISCELQDAVREPAGHGGVPNERTLS